MIYKSKDDLFFYKGIEYHVGQVVIANNHSDYGGFVGVIKEIRTEKDTLRGIPMPEIYCDFIPPIFDSDKERGADIYGPDHQGPVFDGIIMSPEMLSFPNEKDEEQNKVHVYLLREERYEDGKETINTHAYFYFLEAVKNLHTRVYLDRATGCTLKWLNKKDFVEHITEWSYQAFLSKDYKNNHLILSITDVCAPITPATKTILSTKLK